MNERVSKFLLAGDRFMPEMHLRQPVDGPFTRNKKEYKNLKKHEIHNIFIKTNWIKLAFNLTWIMDVLKIKHLILLKIQNVMNIKEVLLQWLT